MARSGSLASRGPDAEARYATVLKCDLVDSTRTKKPLDLEGQFVFQRKSQQVMTEVAARYGEHIERFEGDGALIVFGYPQSREDAAESAVRMGLNLVQAIGEAEILPGSRLHLRVGIASGLIAVLTRPSHPKEDSVVGVTIDLAERLRAEAQPDQVLIAGSTKRLTGDFFCYEDLEELLLKGFDEGIRAWRVAGISKVVSRFQAQRYHEGRGGLVGREDALARLAEAWKSTLAGHGQAVCLIGDAGIGKSRLARAALDAAVRDGATTLEIDCTPSTGNTPLFPIGVLLRRTANIAPASSNEEKQRLAQKLLRRFLPEGEVPRSLALLAPLFGLEGVPIPARITPTELRDQTIATIVRMMSSLAAERPIVVLCEDLHWADDTTVTVVARVCNHIELLRAMILVTMRPSADQPPLNVASIASIPLQPLDRSAATDLVLSIAQGEALSPETVSRIVDRSEGVPLILEEVTRSTLETAGRPEDLRAGSISASNVPTSLQLVIQSRLSRWPQLAPIVQSASILGRDFSVPMLETMLSPRESEVAEALELLAREGLFEKSEVGPHDRARFKHIMICEAVYNTLLASDKQRLHSEVADILSRHYRGTLDAAPDLIAEHLYKSRRFVEAINVRLAESTRTASRGAYIETEGHCVAALAFVDEVADAAERTALQFRLLIQLGVARTGQHGYSAPVVEDAYRRAQVVCGDSAGAEMLYPIMRGLATVNLVRGDLATAYDLSIQGLQLAEQSQRLEFRIDAMSVLCYTTFYFGRLADCREWIERCLRLYRVGHGDQLTYPVPQDAGTAAIALLPTVAWLLGDAQGAEEAVHDGLAHVESLDRDFDRALLHAWIAGTRYTQRRYAEALESAGIAVSISQHNGYREWFAIGTLVALLAQAALRPDPQALAQAAAICTEFAREGVGLNASYYLWALARGHTQAGDAQMARHMLVEASRRAELSRETRMNAELAILQVELESDDGRAAELLNAALMLAKEQGDLTTALRATATLVVRFRGRDTDAEYARVTLAMLDGQISYPNEPNWMTQRLAVLQHVTGCVTALRS